MRGTTTRSAGVRVTVLKQAVQEFQDDLLVCCMPSVLIMWCMSAYLSLYILFFDSFFLLL